MVGGRYWSTDPLAGQVNVATSMRQPGSAMKPITYLGAFQKGWVPSTVVDDKPIQLESSPGKKYTVQNFDGKYSGQVTASGSGRAG